MQGNLCDNALSKTSWIVSATLAVFLFNVWEHLPIIIPSHFSDIAYVFSRDYTEVWASTTLPVPYRDYVLEYPVLIGLLIHGLASFVHHFIKDFSVALIIYILLTDAVLLIFTLGTVVLIKRLSRRLGLPAWRIYLLFIFMPTTLMFLAYNWDTIAVFFAVASIHLFVEERRHSSALMLGLGISTKLYPSVLMPTLLLELKTWRDRFVFFSISTGTFITLNSFFMLTNFGGWLRTWTFHTEWIVEDSWLVNILGVYNPSAKFMSLSLLLLLILVALKATDSRRYEMLPKRIAERSMLMALAWLLASYIVTPQMALFLLPFLVLVPAVPLPAAYIADILNALIIVFWFTSRTYWMEPTLPGSPSQLAATIRQLFWLAFFIHCLWPSIALRTRRLVKSFW